MHAKAYKEYYSEYYVKELNEAWWAKLREMGAVQDRYPGIMEAFNMAPDHLLTLGIPEFEFPRSDLRSNVHWFGAFKKAGAKGDDKKKKPELPSWWDDIAKAKSEGKKIVAVSQGTVEADLEDVLLPTIEALKERDDVLVIATTVLVEPGDVKNLVVPGNTRVAKFVPYDLLLPLVSRVISSISDGVLMGHRLMSSSRTADMVPSNTAPVLVSPWLFLASVKIRLRRTPLFSGLGSASILKCNSPELRRLETL